MRYKIQEAARMLGISPQTLRFYEQYGISVHERVGDGQYRHYSDTSIDLLMSLRKCRNCGFTVAQTAEIIRQEDAAQLVLTLQGRAEAMERQAEMQTRIAQSMRAAAELMKRSESLIGRYEVRKRPAGCALMIKRPGTERLDAHAMARVAEWAEWMPLVRWMTRYPLERLPGEAGTEKGFVTDKKTAAFLGAERQEGVERLPECVCLYTVIRWHSARGGPIAGVREGLAYMEENGIQLAGAPVVSTFWNVNVKDDPISYGECWFPIQNE